MCYQLFARSKAVTESSLKEIFSYFDTNESGDIDRYELEALLDFFHLPRSEYTADGIMARLDVNHDGVLSEEEWLNFMLREMEPPMSGIPGDPLHISVRYYAACSRYSRQGESMWMKLYAWLAKDDARKARALRNYRDLHWWNDLNTARQLFVVAVVCFCAHAAWRYAATLFHLVHALVSSDAAAAAAAAAAAPNGTGGDALGGASLEQQAAAILLMPLIVFGSTQLVSVFVPDGHESSVKWVTLTLALVMYQTISMWSQTVSFDKSISISALDLSLGEILIFTAVVDHFQKMRETQVEKKEQMQDWVEHAADRRRVNVSLNTIDARGNLALRTLREQSLYEVFPSKHVADRLIDAAEEIDPGVQARAPSGALIVIAKGKLFTQAKQTHKRLVDQLTNYVSSINGSGFIDKDCGAPALEVNYVFGLTFEKEVNRKSAANEKFKILLVREDLLAKAHLKGDDEIADPLMHPMAQAYFKKRWRQLQDMVRWCARVRARWVPRTPPVRVRALHFLIQFDTYPASIFLLLPLRFPCSFPPR